MLVWLLSATQEDKSLQQSVNLFKYVYEEQSQRFQSEELRQLEEEKALDKESTRRMGRPKQYKSKLPKSTTNVLSSSPVAYSKARGRLPAELVKLIFDNSADFGNLPQESWYGLNTYITDGTYVQLQDTEEICSEFPPVEGNGRFPQALLQVFIRQGSGQISRYAAGSWKQSELQLVIPMIKELKPKDLLLADDLYNSYYHFCLILSQKAHIIVPGKRERNYTVIKTLGKGDELVEIKKGNRPDYVDKEEWKTLPESIRLRRITYTYPTKDGNAEAALYSTLTDEKISATDMVLKYAMRWDIEISIREIKTLMDINVLRGKSPDILLKELGISLAAYNMVRKIIARSADKADFFPQGNIFQKCAEISRPLLLDKKGRVFHRWSPGRYGKTVMPNK
ncbi:MAG: IS4 family transposase [Flavobacteriaceae bacterium]|nr:IS4 family transposase [Flavobacteriaceae bacterium]